MSATLFEEFPTPSQPADKLSADRRRTIRQAQALAAGAHPLGLAVGHHIRLHPDAPPADDKTAPGPRCGTCWHRTLDTHHNRTYAKCTYGHGTRISHGAGTDVRAWWPACADHSPGEPELSPDAARWQPDEMPAAVSP